MIAAGRLALLCSAAALALTIDQRSPAAQRGAIRFENVTAAAKIGFVHQSGASPEKRMVETFGSGVAWIDYDNDGFPDLFFVNGAPGSPNVLYHNNHDGTFTDVTKTAGINTTCFGMGGAVGDYNNDGWPDLYLTCLGGKVAFTTPPEKLRWPRVCNKATLLSPTNFL